MNKIFMLLFLMASIGQADTLQIKKISPIKSVKNVGDRPAHVPKPKWGLVKKVPPKFVTINATGVTDTTVIISYDVTEPVYTQIHYGLNTTYGSFGPKIENFDSKSFDQILTNLLPNTMYHYRIKVIDKENITVLSSDHSFITNKMDLFIGTLDTTAIGETTSTISLSTNYKVKAEVQYGTGTEYENVTKSEEFKLEHNLMLSGLLANTLYNYRVIATDEDGRITKNENNTFQTIPEALTAVVTEASGIQDNYVTVNVASNYKVQAEVLYGKTTEYGLSVKEESFNYNTHTLGVSGLEPSTPYHYKVVVTNEAGAALTTDDYTFTTAQARLSATVSEATDIRDIDAILHVEANYKAQVELQYGKTITYGLSSKEESFNHSTHNMKIVDLEPETTYHYRFVIITESGETITTNDYTFTTDLPYITGQFISWNQMYPTIEISRDEKIHMIATEKTFTYIALPYDLISGDLYTFRIVVDESVETDAKAFITFNDNHARQVFYGPGTHIFTMIAEEGDNEVRLFAYDKEIVYVDFSEIATPIIVNNTISKIAQSSDDVEELSGREGLKEGPDHQGEIYINSSDLEVTYDSNTFIPQNIGLRFTNLVVPKNAKITRAYIQFSTDEVKITSSKILINGQHNANPVTFGPERFDVSSRDKTDAEVEWAPNIWAQVGERTLNQRTADLRNIVQEIVNLTDWKSGNAMAFILHGSSFTNRVAVSYDKDPANAAELFIEYTLDNRAMPPAIEVNGNVLINIGLGKTYVDEGAKSIDSRDGDITSGIVTVNNVNTNVTGNYQVTYESTDSNGNVQKATRNVYVNKVVEFADGNNIMILDDSFAEPTGYAFYEFHILYEDKTKAKDVAMQLFGNKWVSTGVVTNAEGYAKVRIPADERFTLRGWDTIKSWDSWAWYHSALEGLADGVTTDKAVDVLSGNILHGAVD